LFGKSLPKLAANTTAEVVEFRKIPDDRQCSCRKRRSPIDIVRRLLKKGEEAGEEDILS
jgi:hypothetical protein